MKKILTLCVALVIGSTIGCDAADEIADAVEDVTSAVGGKVKGKVVDQDGNALSGVEVLGWNMVNNLTMVPEVVDLSNPQKPTVKISKMVSDYANKAEKTTTGSGGTYSIKGLGVWILVFQKECYSTGVLGIKESDRSIPTNLDEIKKVAIVVDVTDSTGHDIKIGGGCEPTEEPPAAEEVPEPPPITPPEEPPVQIVDESTDASGNTVIETTTVNEDDTVTVTTVTVNPDTGEKQTEKKEASEAEALAAVAAVDDNLWQSFVVTTDMTCDATDANVDNCTIGDEPYVADITGQAPAAFEGNSAVLVVDVSDGTGVPERSISKVKLAEDGTFETEMKLIPGKKTALSMGYPPGMGQNDPTNKSYVVVVDDVSTGQVEDFIAILSWDKTGEGISDGIDLDIHAIAMDQETTEVYWGNMSEEWGALDVDNRVGYGPEVITIGDSNPTGAENGAVMLGVHAWNDPAGTIATVRVLTKNSDTTFVDDEDENGEADNLKNSKDWWIIGSFNINGPCNEEGCSADEPVKDETEVTKDEIVVGSWYSSAWGTMVFEQDGDTFKAAYDYRDGTVTGTFADGVVTGWWCEENSSGRGGTGLEGDVEFTFVRMDDGGIFLDGKWRHGTDGSWSENWDLFSQEEAAPAELQALFDNADNFCTKP